MIHLECADKGYAFAWCDDKCNEEMKTRRRRNKDSKDIFGF